MLAWPVLAVYQIQGDRPAFRLCPFIFPLFFTIIIVGHFHLTKNWLDAPENRFSTPAVPLHGPNLFFNTEESEFDFGLCQIYL